MITQKTIAEKLGLCRGTVSLALSNSPLVNEKTSRKVWELAEKLDYTPNNYGRALKSGQSRLLGCNIGSVLNSFFGQLLEGVGCRASASSYGILTTWYSFIQKPDKISELENQMLTHRVEGFIFAGNPGNFEKLAARLCKKGILVVFCSTHLHGDFPFVVTDDNKGGKMSVQYLIDCGHRKILLSRNDYGLRLKSALAVAEKNGIETVVFDKEANLPELVKQSGATGIVFFDDRDAISALYTLRQAHLRVPEDVSVIGYDNLPICALQDFELTTVGQQHLELGKLAADYLIRRKAGEELSPNMYLDPELVIRKTVKKIP